MLLFLVLESRFDHDSGESIEEDDEELDEDEGGGDEVTPQSHTQSATPEEIYLPSSPPLSPVELKKELPKYLPALQVRLAESCFALAPFHLINTPKSLISLRQSHTK